MNRFFFERAVQDARRGIRLRHGGPFGAVITKGKRILSVAHNTVLRDSDPTCHAEINAIRRAAKRLKSPFLDGCEIYSTTEPCPMCFSAIHWARLKKIYYASTIHDVKILGFNELTISGPVMKKLGKSRVTLVRVNHPASLDLLQQWKLLRDKKTY